MSWRSWVDDCPSGILANCAMDRTKKRVLTQTQAAYESYNQTLGLDETAENNVQTEENYTNFPEMNRRGLLLLFLLTLVIIFYLNQ